MSIEQQTYDDVKTVEQILRQELSTTDPSYYQIYEYPRSVEDIDHGVTSRFGIRADNNKPIMEFYTLVIEGLLSEQGSFIIKKYSSREKYIQAIVRHEKRHLQQYQFMVNHNLPIDNIFNEAEIHGENSILEKDAIAYENGVATDSDLYKIFGLKAE